ncbi:MAG: bifunctional UDP-N-acetylglucosamine diphosphorylase/glucosamine-1-phosphate N-acetyltransferase GlmU [Actinomycetota bacterium]
MTPPAPTADRPLACIVMAGGKGTRMRSATPKVLHPIWGRPLVGWVLHAVRAAGAERIVVVVPPDAAEAVGAAVDGAETVVQEAQLGKGDAVRVAMPALDGFTGDVLVVSGDTPLLTAELLGGLVAAHRSSGAQATLATFRLDEPGGYGRVIRAGGSVRIVEARDASDDELAVREVNAGLYVFAADALRPALAGLGTDNAQGELYLPDAIPLIAQAGGLVDAAEIADPALLLGVNTRVELAEAAALLRARILEDHMLAGAGIVDPASTYVDADVQLAPDCVVHPGTVLRGATRLATGAEAGPHSVLDGAVLEAGAVAGPFAHLRPGTVLRTGTRVGAFAETKNADVGARSKIPHLSYVGDAEIGEDTNIGAGNITANYDGVDKHRTVIGSRVRTGSDCVFVAPVSVGDDATTGAGSIITDDVPPGALGIARARQVVKENYAQRRRDD